MAKGARALEQRWPQLLQIPPQSMTPLQEEVAVVEITEVKTRVCRTREEQAPTRWMAWPQMEQTVVRMEAGMCQEATQVGMCATGVDIERASLVLDCRQTSRRNTSR